MIVAAVFIAAFLETFVITGYFTYGVVIIGSLAAYFAADGDLLAGLIAALLGGLCAEAVNYWIARAPDRFLSVKQQDRMSKGVRWLQNSRWFGWLLFRPNDHGLLTALKFTLYKFAGLLRPASTILLVRFLGSHPRHMPLIAFATLVWAGFYSVLLYKGVGLVAEEL